MFSKGKPDHNQLPQKNQLYQDEIPAMTELIGSIGSGLIQVRHERDLNRMDTIEEEKALTNYTPLVTQKDASPAVSP